jgi:hypothetical protein
LAGADATPTGGSGVVGVVAWVDAAAGVAVAVVVAIPHAALFVKRNTRDRGHAVLAHPAVEAIDRRADGSAAAPRPCICSRVRREEGGERREETGSVDDRRALIASAADVVE